MKSSTNCLEAFLFQNSLLLCNLNQITKGSNKHQSQVRIKDRRVQLGVERWAEWKKMILWKSYDL